MFLKAQHAAHRLFSEIQLTFGWHIPDAATTAYLRKFEYFAMLNIQPRYALEIGRSGGEQ